MHILCAEPSQKGFKEIFQQIILPFQKQPLDVLNFISLFFSKKEVLASSLEEAYNFKVELQQFLDPKSEISVHSSKITV